MASGTLKKRSSNEISITPISNSNYTAISGEYSLISNGIVAVLTIGFQVVSPSSSSIQVFTLPTGYRPKVYLNRAAVGRNKNLTDQTLPLRFSISPSGKVEFSGGTSGDRYFESITYPI